MKVKDIMTTNLICVGADEPVERAAQIMKEHNVGSVPVCEGERVIGIVTDRDITLRHVAHSGAKNKSVSDVMTYNPVLGSPDMEAGDAAELMGEKQIRRLPIVEGSALVGIVALGDLSVQPKLKDNAGKALSGISEPSEYDKPLF